MWSGQFVKSWSKTLGVLALSSGESELAAVVRAATGGIHVAIESDATAAIGMVHQLGLGRIRHVAVGDLWVQHHVHENSRLENVRTGETERCANQVSWARTTDAPHESCNWVPVIDDGKL